MHVKNFMVVCPCPLGSMNVCIKFHSDPSNSLTDRQKHTETQTDRQTFPHMHLADSPYVLIYMNYMSHSVLQLYNGVKVFICTHSGKSSDLVGSSGREVTAENWRENIYNIRTKS